MALSLPVYSSPNGSFLFSSFLPSNPMKLYSFNPRNGTASNKPGNVFLSVTCSSVKIVRSRPLDKHVEKQNKIRFVQKLKTLLLSKPKHFIPLQILSKCRSYLALDESRSILSMIHRYPTIFELFTIPTPPLPINATKRLTQLCVRLTPAASFLAMQEMNLKSEISAKLAAKLQKLLMLSSHHRLLLSKLVHLAPDLGLPPNFRSRLCNDYPDRFKIVDTSYGRALELVMWDSELAKPIPLPEVNRDLIVDRPLKFKRLRLRKGLNLKRRHHDFLVKFEDSPVVCPYSKQTEELTKESMETEKRACGVVRELLGMTVEKRTLIDHLTHFRKEFGLPNKLRALIVRHPELFYVSLKGTRDSVLLVEAFDEKGVLIEQDETLIIKDRLMELIQHGKRLRRERRRLRAAGIETEQCNTNNGDIAGDEDQDIDIDDGYDDGFDDLFDSDNSDLEFRFDEGDDEGLETWNHADSGEFWTTDKGVVESW